MPFQSYLLNSESVYGAGENATGLTSSKLKQIGGLTDKEKKYKPNKQKECLAKQTD